MKKIIFVIILSLTFINKSISEDSIKKDINLNNLKYNEFVENAPNPKDVLVLKPYLLKGINFVYLGEYANLDYWISFKDNSMQVLITTLDGKSLIMGNVYDKEKNNLNIQSLTDNFGQEIGQKIYVISQKLLKSSVAFELNLFEIKNKELFIQEQKKKELEISKKNISKDEDININNIIWSSLEKSNYIEIGNPKTPVIYMFSDVFCGHCSDLISKLTPYINRNLIHVRYIPVGILSNESITAALALLSAPDRTAAWKDYYYNNNADILRMNLKEEAITMLEQNLNIFQKWNLKGTPSLFFKTRNSNDVKFLYGQPSSIEDFIKDVTQ